MTTRASAIAAVIAGALLLLAPAILNGFPLLFYDTMHYYAGGQKIVSLLAPAQAEIATPTTPAAPEAAPPSSSDRESGRGLMSYMGGRSPYYSAPLYVLTQLMTAWAPAFLQALVGAWLIFMICKAFSLGARLYLIITISITALTALPWMASFLMPDVFGGYAILAAGLLLFAGRALSTAERRGLLLVLIAATAFHTINLLLIIVAAPLTVLILLLQKQKFARAMRALVPLAIAIPVALVATLIYPLAAKAALGKPLPQPPFLMARVLADGPGRDYLREACAAGETYTLCQFKDHKLDHGDTILWSLDPTQGVYRASSWDTQQKLIAEQTRFIIGVVTHKPVQQFLAALDNWRWQLTSFGVSGLPTDAAGWQGAANAGALDDKLIPFITTPVGQGAWTLQSLTELHTLTLLAALLFLTYRLSRPDMSEDERAMVALALFALALIAINAAIAGALSGAFPRYQARVIWLAPLLAMIALARFGLRSDT